ncbi:MAG: pyridoxamine kinase [Oscillospiraceae bacterium]|nr:pyridoxamine kinase [Oscillospiraceae bacterium]
MKQKRILCINDISSMGKCSLTIALPVISAMGIEAVVLPTALLSAHTVFEGYTFRDTTDEMEKIIQHFTDMNERFDCIYTGYLGSKKQVKIVTDLIEKHPESLIITDPVMGDNGRLYSGFERDYPDYMVELCKKSDVIIPNLTEACLITHTPYIAENMSENYIGSIGNALTELSKNAVITGVKEREVIAVYSACKNGKVKKTAETKLIDRQFHGTGDVFASALAGALTLGKNLKDSTILATKFTEMCIEKTNNDKDSMWYGLRFEECLHHLHKMI